MQGVHDNFRDRDNGVKEVKRKNWIVLLFFFQQGFPSLHKNIVAYLMNQNTKYNDRD